MSSRVFLDTNVLLYADDDDAGSKRDVAREVIREAFEEGAGVLSTQVLQEYFVNATRKLGIEAGRARARVDHYLALDVVVVKIDDVLGAIDLCRLHPLSFWDALVVRSAAVAGCGRLLTEDLQDGSTLEGVRIESPFAAASG